MVQPGQREEICAVEEGAGARREQDRPPKHVSSRVCEPVNNSVNTSFVVFLAHSKTCTSRDVPPGRRLVHVTVLSCSEHQLKSRMPLTCLSQNCCSLLTQRVPRRVQFRQRGHDSIAYLFTACLQYSQAQLTIRIAAVIAVIVVIIHQLEPLPPAHCIPKELHPFVPHHVVRHI